MNIPVYHVDAFTEKVFRGNPAAVCLLDSWLPDETLRMIAAEQALPETAFCIVGEDVSQLRWFTAEREMDLCGHATLATAFVLDRFGRRNGTLRFQTVSGILEVEREGEGYTLSLPRREGATAAVPEPVAHALGAWPLEARRSRDLMLVYPSREDVEQMRPDHALLGGSGENGVIVTAPGDGEWDFVSRFFSPGASIPEDPVTGSAHCTLVPYWSRRLNKKRLTACQLSKRRGILFCEDAGEVIRVSGKAALYSRGEIYLDETCGETEEKDR